MAEPLPSAEGRFPHAVLPRILGRDFARRVVEGAPELVGTPVWGTGGDLGITRDGTHAVKDAEEAARVDRSRVAGVARSDAGDLPEVVREVTGGRGAQVALNGVGAPVFAALLGSLGPAGRLCVYSAVAGREASLDLFDFYRRRLVLLGINTAILTVEAGARLLDQLRPLFESGRLRPHPRLERHPLQDAARAYQQVARGSASKVVLVPRAATRP